MLLLIFPDKGDPDTQTGRANKETAHAYLAKVYMYLKNWQKSFDNAKTVIQFRKV